MPQIDLFSFLLGVTAIALPVAVYVAYDRIAELLYRLREAREPWDGSQE